MDKHEIILGCDPDHDDAVTIMLVAKSPQIDLLGITVAAGNRTLEEITANALSVCQYLGLGVPVYTGCGRPMVRDKRITADDIHKETGLDRPVFALLRKKAEGKHAVLYIIDTLVVSDGDITLVPTGPLTNIAIAIRLEPRIFPRIREIVFMGSCYQLGNMTPAVEFNIPADADATHMVFVCNRPIIMVGLNVTRKILCYPSVIERMEKIGTSSAILLVDLMRFFSRGQEAIFGWGGGPLHDPLTVAYLIDPAVLITKTVFTEIDTLSVQSYGRTNYDFSGYFKREPNSDMTMEVDAEKF